MLKALMAIAVINLLLVVGGCSIQIPLGPEKEVVLTEREVRQHTDFITIGMRSAFPIWATRPINTAARDIAYGTAFNSYRNALWAHGVLRDALGAADADAIWSAQYRLATATYDAMTLTLIREHATIATELYDGDD